MPGAHQMHNAGLAIAMLRLAPDPHPTDSEISEGIAAAFWPGRMQRLAPGPLTALLPDRTQIWLDGAHNVDAGLALARKFADEPRRIHLVTGMLANKDPAAIIAPLASQLASLTVVPVPGHEHHGAQAFGTGARAAASITDALRDLDVDPERELVLIAGSLYLAGIVLDLNREWPV